jgi:hypothetical protein
MKNAVSGILRRVAFVWTDVSEARSGSNIKGTRMGELGTRLAVRSVRRLQVIAYVVPTSPILVTLVMEALGSSETYNSHTV